MSYRDDLQAVLRQLREKKFTYRVDEDAGYQREKGRDARQTAGRQDDYRAAAAALVGGQQSSYGEAARQYLQRQMTQRDEDRRQQYTDAAYSSYQKETKALERQRESLQTKVEREERQRQQAEERARKERQRELERQQKALLKAQQQSRTAGSGSSARRSGSTGSGSRGDSGKAAGQTAAFDEKNKDFRAIAAQSRQYYTMGHSRGVSETKKKDGSYNRVYAEGQAYRQQARYLYGAVDGDMQKVYALAAYLGIPAYYTSSDVLHFMK